MSNQRINQTMIPIAAFLITFSLCAAPFTDNGDGTITDSGTNLRWQKCSAGQNNDSTCSGTVSLYSWQNALVYCNSLTLGSKQWRLPSVRELNSLVEESRTTAPQINTTFFPNTPTSTSTNGNYWTSTSSDLNNSAYYVSFFQSFSGYAAPYGSKTGSLFSVRCVTTGP
jgi:hypothetical protein